MSFALFIGVFFVILFIGSLAVTGWYFITRGEIKTLEDGVTKKKTGKVFKGWYFYWTRTKPEKKKVYFDEAHLFDLFIKMKPKFHAGGNNFDIVLEGRAFKIKNATKWQEEIRWSEMAYDVKFIEMSPGEWKVYKEYDDYVFPYWVRDPIAVCATCFASIYGSLFYWPVMWFLPKDNIFTWATSPFLAAVIFWGIFCFSLSVINTALAKRFN